MCPLGSNACAWGWPHQDPTRAPVCTAGRLQVSPSLMAALLKHCELKGVWKIKGADGFGNWWATCTEVSQWESMRNLNLSYCNLANIPNTVGELRALRILRLSHNRCVCILTQHLFLLLLRMGY